MGTGNTIFNLCRSTQCEVPTLDGKDIKMIVDYFKIYWTLLRQWDWSSTILA